MILEGTSVTDAERREAARKYINNWRGKGYEKGETAKAWIELLTVLGVDHGVLHRPGREQARIGRRRAKLQDVSK